MVSRRPSDGRPPEARAGRRAPALKRPMTEGKKNLVFCVSGLPGGLLLLLHGSFFHRATWAFVAHLLVKGSVYLQGSRGLIPPLWLPPISGR